MTAGAANPLARDLEEVLETMGDLWQELRGARIFITGGTGFFGCWLLETLLWANDRLGLEASVVVLTRSPEAFGKKAAHLARHAAVTLHEGDVRSFTFPDGAFTHVVHAATSSSVPVAPEEMFETIVGGTRRTLDFARVSGARRFLLTSSGAVYGPQPSHVTNISEDYVGGPDCTSPNNAYGEGKRAGEMLCAVYASNRLQPTIARCFAFVGPYLPLDAHFAIGNFVRDALHHSPVRVLGDGTAWRSYLYGSDLAAWLWTILLRGTASRPYNVGSPTAVTIADIAHAVASEVEPPVPVTIAQTAVPNARIHRYVPDTMRAMHELGTRQTVPLNSAIQRTLAWHAGQHAQESIR